MRDFNQIIVEAYTSLQGKFLRFVIFRETLGNCQLKTLAEFWDFPNFVIF